MPDRPASPYLAPGFYADALAAGRHRDIVGGRWDETGRLQLALLQEAGLRPHHRLLDIGCGSLRLGHRAAAWLDPGNYWGTDASADLMRRGWEVEVGDKSRLPLAQLIADADFAFPGIPGTIDFAIAWGVFTHLPAPMLDRALGNVRARFAGLSAFLFTVFLGDTPGPLRQRDGVVTHPDRPPYHRPATGIAQAVGRAGFTAESREDMLPRGQRLWIARPA